jgi:putative hemolysin
LAPKHKLVDLSSVSVTERKMINELLEMKKKAVNKIMVPKNEIAAFAYNTQLIDALHDYRRYHYSRYPVYFANMDQIIGILYIKDIISFWNEFQEYPVVEFVRLPHFVYEDRPALDVFLELQRLRLSLGVVIDEFGGVSGIITVEDLIEEIVGDIEDEFDKKKKPLIEEITDGEYILNTRMELDEFAERFGLTINEKDVSTVSGLILKYADRIPKVGEEIKYKNLKFTILEGTRRKISKVKVKKL